jgi:sodium transport system permease protein
MSISHAWILLHKELTTLLRDRNALFGFLLVPVLSPLVYGLIFSVVADRVSREANLVLPVAGSANAPALVDWLGQQTGVTVVAAPDDPEREVRDGRRPGVLIIDSHFAERLSQGLPAPVTLVTDSGRSPSQRFAVRVHGLLSSYAGEILGARLLIRGVEPAVVSPVKVREIDTSVERDRSGGILIFLPLLMIWMALVSGMPLALDSSAGERERGSLEPLLLNPWRRLCSLVLAWCSRPAPRCWSCVWCRGMSWVCRCARPTARCGAACW